MEYTTHSCHCFESYRNILLIDGPRTPMCCFRSPRQKRKSQKITEKLSFYVSVVYFRISVKVFRLLTEFCRVPFPARSKFYWIFNGYIPHTFTFITFWVFQKSAYTIYFYRLLWSKEIKWTIKIGRYYLKNESCSNFYT